LHAAGQGDYAPGAGSGSNPQSRRPPDSRRLAGSQIEPEWLLYTAGRDRAIASRESDHDLSVRVNGVVRQ
jgi:hypothetical protein